MKMNRIHHGSRAKRGENGSATLIYIGLLAIMMVLLAANVRTIMRLQREVKLVDQKQVRHWNLNDTNAVQGGQTR